MSKKFSFFSVNLDPAEVSSDSLCLEGVALVLAVHRETDLGQCFLLCERPKWFLADPRTGNSKSNPRALTVHSDRPLDIAEYNAPEKLNEGGSGTGGGSLAGRPNDTKRNRNVVCRWKSNLVDFPNATKEFQRRFPLDQMSQRNHNVVCRWKPN